MDPLSAVMLIWAALATAALGFGILCIKYGVYTTGNHGEHATLEI